MSERHEPADPFAAPLTAHEVERMVEALLFASAEPLAPARIAARLPGGADVEAALSALAARYEGRGIILTRAGGAWAFRTAPDLAALLHHERVETRRLSRAALETLAIIAYHQPVTRAEIEEIRGVAISRGTLDQLMELDWVRLGRRRMTPGRPATFVVTEAFLDHFSLESLRDLPGLAELRAAGLVSRPEPGAGPEIGSEGDVGGRAGGAGDSPGDGGEPGAEA